MSKSGNFKETLASSSTMTCKLAGCILLSILINQLSALPSPGLTPSDLQKNFNVAAKNRTLNLSLTESPSTGLSYRYEIAKGIRVSGTTDRTSGGLRSITLTYLGSLVHDYGMCLPTVSCLVESVDPSLHGKPQVDLLSQLGLNQALGTGNLPDSRTERNGTKYRVWSSGGGQNIFFSITPNTHSPSLVKSAFNDVRHPSPSTGRYETESALHSDEHPSVDPFADGRNNPASNEAAAQHSQWMNKNHAADAKLAESAVVVASRTAQGAQQIATTLAAAPVKTAANESHPSIGITPNELARRFKHSEPGAFELMPFYRNPNTGEQECSVRGIDGTTRISAKVRDSDTKILSITLRWNPPIQDSSEESRHNSATQFFVTFGLLTQAIDSSLSKDERNQLFYDLRLAGTSATLSKDSQSRRDGFAYRTRWSGNKLALTIEPEKEMQSLTSANPQGPHSKAVTVISEPNPQSQTILKNLAMTPDDIALQRAINKLNTLNFPDYPDMQAYKKAMVQAQLEIARLYEKRGDFGRAADYFGMMMTGLGGSVPEITAKRLELFRRIQINPKLNHPANRTVIKDPIFDK